MHFYVLLRLYLALRHGIFRSAMHLRLETFPIAAPVRRHATITLSVTSNDIPSKFFLSQFRCRVRYIERQSLAIKAVRVRSLIVSNYVGRRKKARQSIHKSINAISGACSAIKYLRNTYFLLCS